MAFNVSCSISKISITYKEQAVYVPLLHKSYDYYGIRGELKDRDKKILTDVQSQSFYVYPNDIYNVLCFPIKGTYNEYGGLNNIERNANTDAIEKFFGCSIEDVCNNQTLKEKLCSKSGKRNSSDSISNKNILLDLSQFLSGMFFHRKLYDNMVEDINVKQLEAGYLDRVGLTVDILMQLGFTMFLELESPYLGERQGFMTHECLPKGWYVFADVGGGSLFQLSGDCDLKRDFVNYTPQFSLKKSVSFAIDKGALQLKELIQKHLNFELDISLLSKTKKASLEFDKMRQELKTNPDFIFEGRGPFYPLSKKIDPSSHNVSWTFLNDIYREAIINGTIRQDWVEWFDFIAAAKAANIHWTPSMNGEQLANDKVAENVLKSALGIIEHRRK